MTTGSRKTTPTSPLLDVIADHKRGKAIGIASLCTANRFALQAGMKQALQDRALVCIEATSNQVDQFGGYSGLTPERFAAMVHEIAAAAGLPAGRIVMGGDHLGPNAWRDKDARTAMALSRDLVRAYVLSGFTKIHLDASMPCADDTVAGRVELATRTVAERTAELCAAAEEAYAERPDGSPAPLYVVGTEVPRPGGALEELSVVQATAPADAEETLLETQRAFDGRGLHQAWKRVIAVVVQPGVEFGDQTVIAYDREKARALSALIAARDHLVYEAHSTDYQTPPALRQMVEDHFAILKVGPWLTFAFREAVFALEAIEREWLAPKSVVLSGLAATLDKVMVTQPKYWARYYRGDASDLALARKYSFSDRSRYYWTNPLVQQALTRLMDNLARFPPPLCLLSQYLPVQCEAVMQGRIAGTPPALILDKIMEVTGKYAYACGMQAAASSAFPR